MALPSWFATLALCAPLGLLLWPFGLMVPYGVATHTLSALVGMLLWHFGHILVRHLRERFRRRGPEGKAWSEKVFDAWLKWPSINYSAMFTLGFACSLLIGAFHRESLPAFSPDGMLPVRMQRQAQVASAAISQAVDQMLSSDTMERLLNTTSTLKEVLDFQAYNVSGRLSSTWERGSQAWERGSQALGNTNFGIKDLFNTWHIPDVSQVLGKSERVGIRMARNGITSLRPVVMIPGIITTGLEIWDGEECIKSYFRQRIWGTTSMFRSMLGDPACWLRHLMLNSTTGLDPSQGPYFNKSIRVRPAQGYESADFFLGGYWLWGLMIEALADIGYDLNSMYLAGYDWRLSFADLEKRDRYFTRLRQQIETLVEMTGRKAVIVAHSMGGNVWHYFMQWVTNTVHRNWVHDYISTEALISSPLLGVPKAYYSLLTGHNRDFASMGSMLAVVDHFFGRRERRKAWRSFGSLAHISPIGAELWGEETTGRQLVELNGRNLSMQEAYDLLAKKDSVPDDLKRLSAWLLDGIRRMSPASSSASSTSSPPEHVWANPLAVPLPFAPELRMYAFNGAGVQTEVSAVLEDTGDDVQTPRYAFKETATSHKGLYFEDGDYSCPVHSLGLMCIKGWLNERRNPARIQCTVKEFLDQPSGILDGGGIRGGPRSGDHIDLLGNEELLTDILTLASGGEVDGRIVSKLPEIAKRWHDF